MNAPVFNHRLESLRGLAALMVAGSHCFIFNGGPWESGLVEFLMNFLNGSAAVILFFVLSGYVLGLSLRRFSSDFARETVCFASRRFFRIYPAFLVFTLLVAAAGAALPGWPNCTASDWMQLHSHRAVSPGYVARNLAFLDSTLNPVTWTLKIELVCSVLLPLVHWCSVRLASRGQAVLLLILLLAPKLMLPAGTSIRFLFLFYLGYLLPQVGPVVMKILRTNRWGIPAAWAMSCALLFFGYHTPAWTLVQGVGAIGLLTLVMRAPETRFHGLLDHRSVRFLGRISYSFYLVHMKLMVVIGIAMLVWIPAGVLTAFPLLFGSALFLVSVLTAGGLASILFATIEKPVNRWSKRVCSAFFLRLVPPARMEAVPAQRAA